MEDRISKLPDDLICFNILSRLRTIDAVKTSLLSTKWRNLWKRVPSLTLHSREFSKGNDLVTFINKFLDYHKKSRIRQFQLTFFQRDMFNDTWFDGLFKMEQNVWISYVPEWIEFLRSHPIEHLDLSFGDSNTHLIELPVSMYTCVTLVHLRLVGIYMPNSEFVSLPNLKTIYLRFIIFPNVTVLEKLISSSLVLQDLTILRFYLDDIVDAKPFRLQSQTLQTIFIDHLDYFIEDVVIDAPLLRFLKIKFKICETTRTIYSGVSPKVLVHVKLKGIYLDDLEDEIISIRNSLTCISTFVNDLVITRNAFTFICRFLNVEPFPQFGCISSLNVNLFVTDLKWFRTFLKSCPKLKSLSMEWQGSSEDNCLRFESVPECLLTSLERVNIKTMVSENALEVTWVNYFLENAVSLKKLTLHLDSHPRKWRDSWVGIPTSVALPFGVFEKVLSEKANEAVSTELQALKKSLEDGDQDALKKICETVLGLVAPPKLVEELKNTMKSSDVPWPGDEGEQRWEQAWTAIKKVWASKWNERAYFSTKKVTKDHDYLCMAVLVQEVINADYAFVNHTTNPSSGDSSEIYSFINLRNKASNLLFP